MSILLHNLSKALQEMNERLKLLEQHGPDAIKMIYPFVNLDSRRVYYDLLESLPKEIERLEWKIHDLKVKMESNERGA